MDDKPVGPLGPTVDAISESNVRCGGLGENPIWKGRVVVVMEVATTHRRLLSSTDATAMTATMRNAADAADRRRDVIRR